LPDKCFTISLKLKKEIKMRKFLLVLAVSVWAVTAQAATVHLNSGSVVSGKILESSTDSIKVDVEGVTVTYYKDEVTSIGGDEAAAKTLGVAVIGPAAPVQEAAVEAPKAAEPVVAAPVPAAPAAEPAAAEPTVAAPTPAEPAVAAPTPVAGPSVTTPGNKKDKVLKFIEVFGTRDTMKMNFDQIMSSMPPEDSQKLKQAFNIDDVILELVPLYDKYFTAEDLDSFIAFYSSPAGKKLVQNIPLIMKESVDISAKYFEEHMPSDMKEGPATLKK
jgi:hypothetical protein